MSYYPTFSEIIDALQARCEDVARRYAPGGRVDGGRYWALNPGRDDRHIGSFHISLQGAYRGRWRDESMGEGGDMLDLIQLALKMDRKAALEEAKAFLGMANETPQARELRLKQQAKAKQQQEADEKELAEKQAKRQKQAHAIWLSSKPKLDGTPVAAYLRRRAIGLDRLGRTPHVLRYHPDLQYYYMDKKTGEITEGRYPAMVAAIQGPWLPGGERPVFYGIHKTYLARDANGHWGKAPVPKAKLIWGTKKGGYVRCWAGMGPRGGKGASLSKAMPGSKLYISEGIEDALSMAVLDRTVRVAAAIDLGNIQQMRLPPNISEVVLIADNDPDPAQMEPINRAIDVFSAEGRRVRLWRNNYGGKDLNDALVAAMQAEQEDQEGQDA